MNHGSLFSGIGGFDLAAEWMGWNNIFHCEWNPFGQRILKYYFPNSISYDDITKTDFTIHAGKIDILTGGFPCQPYSQAGKRLGKDDERHLWPEMLRAVKEIKPTWVIGENVYGIVNWNGGLVFDEVQTDLENEGYEVQAYILPACAVNAPHRRDRVWFVAHSKHNRHQTNTGEEGKEGGVQEEYRQKVGSRKSDGTGLSWDATNTQRIRLQHRKVGEEVEGRQGEVGKKRSEPSSPIKADGEFRNAPNTNEQRLQARGELCEPSNKEQSSRSYPKGSSTDTESQRYEPFNKSGSTKFQTQEGQAVHGRSGNISNKPSGWADFPTQSPVCQRDDGISDRLDSITFSKWRNESIKGLGNAIVPQVAYQLFKTIIRYTQSTPSP